MLDRVLKVFSLGDHRSQDPEVASLARLGEFSARQARRRKARPSQRSAPPARAGSAGALARAVSQRLPNVITRLPSAHDDATADCKESALSHVNERESAENALVNGEERQIPASELARLTSTLRRLATEVNGSNMRQTRLAEKLDRLLEGEVHAHALSSPVVATVKAPEAPEAVISGLDALRASIEGLHAKLAEAPAGQGNAGPASDQDFGQQMKEFLQGISASVDRLSDLQREALEACRGLSKRQESTIRSQRMHMVELRRQQEEALFEIERDHQQRLQSHIRKARDVSRRQSVLSACMMVALGACVLIMAHVAGQVSNLGMQLLPGTGADSAASPSTTTPITAPMVVEKPTDESSPEHKG